MSQTFENYITIYPLIRFFLISDELSKEKNATKVNNLDYLCLCNNLIKTFQSPSISKKKLSWYTRC